MMSLPTADKLIDKLDDAPTTIPDLIRRAYGPPTLAQIVAACERRNSSPDATAASLSGTVEGMRLPWVGISRYGIGFGLQHVEAGTIAVAIAAREPIADEADDESDLGAAAMTQDARVVQPSSASYPVADGPTTGYSRGQAHPNIWITHVDGFPIERNTATAFVAMRTAAARDGIELRIVSGFRTMEHQRALYAEYLAGRGPLAAAPGHSNHQMGNAIDLNTRDPGVLRWLNAHARAFRIYRTVRPEPWHWEFSPVGVPVFS